VFFKGTRRRGDGNDNVTTAGNGWRDGDIGGEGNLGVREQGAGRSGESCG